MTEVIGWVMANGVTVFEGLISIVGGFALLATMTPNKTDDRIIQTILDGINFMAGNFGKSKNS